MRRHPTGNSSVSLAATEGGKPKRFRAALNAEMAAFKTSQRPRNVYRLAELRDQNEAKGAAVQAIRALEELAQQAEAAPPSDVRPGIVVIIPRDYLQPEPLGSGAQIVFSDNKDEEG